MRLSKRIRTLAWEGLGWSAAAGLAIALAVTVGLGLTTERQLRAELAASQLVGLMMIRYGLRIEPIASAPAEELVRRVGPVVQAHLLGEAPGSGS